MYVLVLNKIVIYSIFYISEVSIEMFNRKGSILTKNNLAFEAKQEKIKISKSNYYNTKKSIYTCLIRITRYTCFYHALNPI